jgi:geranylgeranyl reductase family protein
MQNITKKYDVLIVGAGPAGSNAAISYKELNPSLRVGLIDKATFPRDKSCGDAIGPGVISALKRFNNEHILENEPQVVSTTLYGPDNIGIQNYIPEVKNKEDSIVYVIPRIDLDNRILNLAKDLDVDVTEGLSFVSFEEDTNKNILVKFKNKDEEFLFSTKLLVGADGANSRIRKQLNLKQNSDWHKAIAIRAYIDSPNYIEIFNERTLMFEINVSAEKGYAWAFPSKGNLLNIGIGVPVSIFKKDKLNINQLLKDFISQLESRGVIVENIRKQKSYMLPFASSRPKLKKNINIALIGDASSMINPISGEGIFYGMEAGYLLAKNTNELVRSEELSSGILKYEKEFSNRFRKHYLSCALARLILQSPFMTKRLLKVASKDQDTIDFVIELLFDEAYLTLSEVIKISYKFLIPTRLLAFISKN